MNNAVIDRIDYLERWCLINCYLYYERDTSIIDDMRYLMEAVELKNLITENPTEFRMSKYCMVFEDFDISTGFDLWHRLKESYPLRVGLIEWQAETALSHFERRKT